MENHLAFKRGTKIRIFSLFVAFVVVGAAAAAYGQTDSWKGGAGLWSDGTKWSASVPTSTSNVFIDHGTAGASAVTLNFNGAQCANLTIDSDDSLAMVDGTIFTLNGPTVSNAGNISLNSAGFGTYFNFGGAVTLTGAGAITMSNNSANYLMGYAQPSGAAVTNQSTIQGAGQIGFNGGIGSGNSFTNKGTINANQTNPFTINIGGSATFNNAGLLEATAGATLALENGTITNTGGTIHADPSSIVTLESITINGGTLTTSGSGTIQANCCLSYSTLNGATLNGTFQLNSNNIGYLQGAITNNGSMQLNAPSGTNVDLVMNGAVTLKGTGSLTSNNSNNQIMGYGQSSPASLTNQVTIQGSAQIGGAGGIGSGNTFTNQATLNANQSANPFTINVGSGTVTNTGMFEATNGATLALQNGTITNTTGTIHADPASTVTLYGATLSGGTLTTSGTGKFVALCCLGYSTLDGVTINGAFQWNSNNIGYLQGTITNNGPMTFNSPSGTNVVLDVNGAVTLKGTGTLTSTNVNNAIMGYAQSSGASLLNQSTIQGTVVMTAGGGNTITNQGTMYANQSSPLTIATGNGGTFTNTGSLKVKSGSTMSITGGGFPNFSGTTLTGGKYMIGGTLEFDGASIANNAANISLMGVKGKIINQSAINALANFSTNMNTGTFSLTGGALLSTSPAGGNFTNNGKMVIGKSSGFQVGSPSPYTQTGSTAMTTVDGVLTTVGGVTINSGKLFGNGTIAASVVSKASVIVGDSLTKAGKLSPSSYSQTSTGTLNVQIGGASTDTQYSHLAVANGASLAGTLSIKLINGFIPALTDSFTIVTSSALTGTFATVKGASINNGTEHFVVHYNSPAAGQVTLTVASGP